MNPLQIQDVFAPYYAGREEADAIRTPARAQPAAAAVGTEADDHADNVTLIGGRRRSIRPLRGGAKGL